MKSWPFVKLIPVKTNLRFVSFARIAATLSIIGVVASLVLCFKPGFNLGIDFSGGTILELVTPGRALDVGKAREAADALGLGDVQVQPFGVNGSEAQVRFQPPPNADPNQITQRVQDSLRTALGNDIRFTRTDVVGPKVSGELFFSGVMALALATLLMMIYIWFRFELQFGIGALAGLFHDLILTLGFMVVTRLEFSLTTIAALLTVIGYSMNDTVVVFDRLRENLKKYKRTPLREVIDLSLNETLSRTMITGPAGIMALVGLAVFGGETLFSFSVVLIFGICMGTYSSIYVGAPIILLWGVKRGEADQPDPQVKGKAVVQRP